MTQLVSGPLKASSIRKRRRGNQKSLSLVGASVQDKREKGFGQYGPVIGSSMVKGRQYGKKKENKAEG